MKRRILLPLVVLISSAASIRAANHLDVEYGRAAGESLRLDAGIPEGPGPFAAVILVHGGGWTGGDKSGGPKKAYIAPLQDPLQRAGLAWFSINYRLAPKHPYPACLDDVLTAVRWVKAHAADYRLDPGRIALAGESAGGHLVALAAVRAGVGERVAAVIPIYGRFDLTDQFRPGAVLRGNTTALLGRPTLDETAHAVAREASPLLHIKAGLPPFLLVHGTADTTVPYDQSVQLQARLRAHGVPCDFLTITGGVHGMISWDRVAPTYQQDIVTWIARTLQVERRQP